MGFSVRMFFIQSSQISVGKWSLSYLINFFESLLKRCCSLQNMITKSQVVDSLKHLPDQFPIETLIDRLLLAQKVSAGWTQSEQGETHSPAEARALLKKWRD